MTHNSFKVILFDLGGVLVELGDSPIPSEWLTAKTTFNLNDWFNSEPATLFEKGLIAPDEFVAQFKSDLSIQASSTAILSHFAKWPIGLYSDVSNLLLKLKEKYTLGILTNTNEIHWPRIIDEFSIPKYFDHLFASHLLNMAKPDLCIFQHVISELKVNPEEVLFFDDNFVNVEASRKLGIEGVHVADLQELLDSLKVRRIEYTQ